jgi:hypothetical protein
MMHDLGMLQLALVASGFVLFLFCDEWVRDNA